VGLFWLSPEVADSVSIGAFCLGSFYVWTWREDVSVPMPEIGPINGCIDWIGFDLEERELTLELRMKLGFRVSLAGTILQAEHY